MVHPDEKTWTEVMGEKPGSGQFVEDFKEVFDFTRESLCMSDPEVAYVAKITCAGEDVTSTCIYANKYFGIVITAIDPAQLADRDVYDVDFTTTRGEVTIEYNIEGCVKDNEGRATIILPVI